MITIEEAIHQQLGEFVRERVRQFEHRLDEYVDSQVRSLLSDIEGSGEILAGSYRFTIGRPSEAIAKRSTQAPYTLGEAIKNATELRARRLLEREARRLLDIPEAA